MCAQSPKEWSSWLPLDEWWYNTTYHSATQLTPYEGFYNQPPLVHLPCLPGESSNTAMDISMQKSESMIKLIQQNLQRAQNRMKQLADKGQTDRKFQTGDWVWLKL